MKTLRKLFSRSQPIYTARIFEIRTWRDQEVTEALFQQALDINLTTNPNIQEQ
tara:strand:+ start:208 stop:366 length:159 start_codon:yes stop_codon:yes gene_type:complete